jgi:polyisoprenoid-binding protein YceI
VSALHHDPVVAPTARDVAAGVRGVRPGSYRVEPTCSTVAFRVRELGLFTVAGTVALRRGRVQVGAGVAQVSVEVDAASFATSNRRRDAGVRGPRFLDAVGFPALSWSGTLTDGHMDAPGTLRVRDTTTSVPAEVDRVEVEPGRVQVHARMQVDRVAAGVVAGRGVAGRLLDVEVALALLPE